MMASWGGSREGAGRKKKTTNKAEKRLRLRISEGLYHRWTELKNLRKARNDEEVFSYLLDLAREVDQGPVTRYWYVLSRIVSKYVQFCKLYCQVNRQSYF